ncbi:hypothetical protein EVAR_65572_1 [Eumeta japonica]|uniref:Uncharacterized protein n=1 Tax=Eumeta variegata TaxID=151549 RepID=A0A4C1Z7T7_EUMVA|nr:hypothetical protein EVAR_65572_1 [Eumeta japonica]
MLIYSRCRPSASGLIARVAPPRRLSYKPGASRYYLFRAVACREAYLFSIADRAAVRVTEARSIATGRRRLTWRGAFPQSAKGHR